LLSSATQAQTPEQPESTPSEFPEDLYFSESELMVVTSGREEMSLKDVSESMWVLTEEEIRRSGATNVAELLRMVPGITAQQVTNGHYEVYSRDHERWLSHRMLVLIDGKPVYFNFFKVVVWPSLPLVIEEIDHIEVVLGPGSTLYGTNAMLATINIITKRPEGSQVKLKALYGPQVNEGLDYQWDNIYLSGVWLEDWGDVASRLSVAYNRTPSWNQNGQYPDDGGEYVPSQALSLNSYLNWQISADQELSLRNGANWFDGDYIPFNRYTLKTLSYLGELRYAHSNPFLDQDYLEASVYVRVLDLKSGFVLYPNLPASDFHTLETSVLPSLLYRFTLADKLTSTIGAEADIQQSNTSFAAEEAESLEYFSVFIHEKYRPFDELILTAGLRLENQILAGKDTLFVVPKGGIVYTPVKNHILRASAGQAFQHVSVLEGYGKITIDNDTPWGFPALFGDPNITRAKMTNFELGYEYHYQKSLMIKMEIFYSQTEDTISLTTNPNPPPTLTFTNNSKKGELFGGEIGVSYRHDNWLGIKAAYGLSMDQGDYVNDVPQTPRHRVYLSSWLRPTDRLELNLNFHLHTSTSHESMSLQPSAVNPVEMLNIRIAYTLTENIDLVMTAYNLLNVKWGTTLNDNSLDTEHQLYGSDIIGRRFMLGVEMRL
jgi:iron complex outermembrane receptor protein